MRAPRTVWVVFQLALFCVVGCDEKCGSAGNAAPSAAVAAPHASSAPAAPQDPSALASARALLAFAAKGRTRHHVGLAGVLLRSAYDLTLNDEQRSAIDKAEDGLYADAAASPSAAVKAFQTDLVAGIRAAKLDTAKLQTDYAAIDKAVQAGQAREVDALGALHAALDATQRRTLVDQVKARRAARERTGRTPVFAKRRLERITAELALDDAQQKVVAAAIAQDAAMTPAAMQARREATQKKVEALLAAFTQDTFDAKKQDLSTGGKTLHDAMERSATFTAAILSTLHPDQLEKFALRTDRMGNRPGRYFEDAEPAPGPSDDEWPPMPIQQ
jgi:hypothetical protein